MTVPELTFTEERIVLLLAAGKTTEEVALLLGLDGRTVEWHLARADRKLEQMSALQRDVHKRRRR